MSLGDLGRFPGSRGVHIGIRSICLFNIFAAMLLWRLKGSYGLYDKPIGAFLFAWLNWSSLVLSIGLILATVVMPGRKARISNFREEYSSVGIDVLFAICSVAIWIATPFTYRW